MRRIVAALAFALSFLLAAVVVRAGEAAPLAEDPVVEQRLLAIAEEVRCLVCQNESLAGSRAELAQDLRREIRHLIRQGKSDADVLDFLVSRYGDFVRYRPPLKPTTWVLWGGPFVLLAVALLGLVRCVQRRRDSGVVLTTDEQGEGDDLLGEGAR